MCHDGIGVQLVGLLQEGGGSNSDIDGHLIGHHFLPTLHFHLFQSNGQRIPSEVTVDFVRVGEKELYLRRLGGIDVVPSASYQRIVGGNKGISAEKCIRYRG